MFWVITILVSVIIMVVALLFIGSAIFNAYYQVKNTPREDMFWCHKHGTIRKKLVLDLGYTQVCPLCYREALEKAEQSS